MVKVYYWRGGDGRGHPVGNCGDRLNWTFLHKLEADPVWYPPEQADLVVMGSVLEHLPSGWTGTVCGAGKMFAEPVDLSAARVLALRGKLTAKGVRGAPRDVVLGDPALLAPTWWRPQVPTEDLGVVPHWSDKELWNRFRYGKLIDITGHPEKVVEEISKCKRIISSSLHGLVLADAFGIPRRAELFPDATKRANHEGGDFKFHDYASVFNTHPHFGEFWTAPYDEVRRIQERLRRALAEALDDALDWLEPADPDPTPTLPWWDWWPCHWRRPQISFLVPFRDDDEYRTDCWHWLRRYWRHHFPHAEIVEGHSRGAPFAKTIAINDAASRARGRIFVILDADAYMSSDAIQVLADNIDAAVRHHRRLWYMPYDKLYRLSEEATLGLLETDPRLPYQVSSPPPPSWIEPGRDPSGGRAGSYGHQFGAMVMMMPRRAFFMAEGMDPRFDGGWGGEDVSFLRALDALYCQHEVAHNDLCHFWHARAGTDFRTRRWVGQHWTPANQRIAHRYTEAAGDPAVMRVVCDDHAIKRSWLQRRLGAE